MFPQPAILFAIGALPNCLNACFCFLLLGSWPTTQEAAEKAVQDHRQALRADGAMVDEVAPWSSNEIILATLARIPLLKGALCSFQTGVEKLNRLLWPAAQLPTTPDTTTQVTAMLVAAPGVFVLYWSPPPTLVHRCPLPQRPVGTPG